MSTTLNSKTASSKSKPENKRSQKLDATKSNEKSKKPFGSLKNKPATKLVNTELASTPKLEKLIKKEQQLKALIEKEKARLSRDRQKQRNAKLLAWGLAVEALVDKNQKPFTPNKWANHCKNVLSGRQLEAALVDELSEFGIQR